VIVPEPIIGAIELTPEEGRIWSAMIRRQEEFLSDYDAVQKNGEMVNQLMISLVARGAIPEVRLKYFSDTKFSARGRQGSHYDQFKTSNRTDEEVYSHPNFLSFLRYFVLGADLPPTIVEEFSAKAFRYGHVGPSDALELGQLARQQVRKFGLAPHDVDEEYYRLALDCGIYQGHAERVRDVVRKTR
jgi:hypothetical protein